MDPILCHICGCPLKNVRTEYHFYSDNIKRTNWICLGDSNDIDDDTGHCWIITLPRLSGSVARYSVLIKNGDKSLYLDSSSISETTEIQVINCTSSSDISFEISNSIPKFYNLKLKLPLKPQFDQIYQNVKLLLTFS